MPYYHKREDKNGLPCNQLFVQVRCPSCGTVVGLTEYQWRQSALRMFCPKPECVEAVPCQYELSRNLDQMIKEGEQESVRQRIAEMSPCRSCGKFNHDPTCPVRRAVSE